MSAGHSQPQVLYAINNIRAYHVQDGEEHEITTQGPQTMTLLMVPTSSPFADLSSTNPSSSAPEEDFYLHLQLPPELDQPLPATTQVYHKPPSSYLIPRWDLGPESGAFIRVEFPSIGTGPGKVTQDDVDTFETILAQCTAFLERAVLPASGGKAYNPADYRPGEGYVTSSEDGLSQHGQIVLIDEENGSVVGELQGNLQVIEAPGVRPGSKNPVEIQLPQEGQGNQIMVSNVSDEYLAMAKHPAYAKSTIVQTSAKASRLLVTGGNFLAKAMTSGADTFQKKTQPDPTPMTFSPAAHDRLRRMHTFTEGAVGLSAKTVGQFSRYAQNLGATLARKGEKPKRGQDEHGNPDSSYKPGILNKSMIAFSTVMDGIDHAGRQLLTSGSAAASNIVGHKYGAEARNVATSLTGGVRNVGLVYIDAAGVSRKALIKSVAKGMVVGRMPNGQQLVVGAGDGGVVPAEAYPSEKKNNDYYAASEYGDSKPGEGVEAFGNATAHPPPAYGSHVGEPAGSTLQGQQYREKR